MCLETILVAGFYHKQKQKEYARALCTHLTLQPVGQLSLQQLAREVRVRGLRHQQRQPVLAVLLRLGACVTQQVRRQQREHRVNVVTDLRQQ